MEDKFELTFLTSIGNTKRIQIKNANISLPKTDITTAFNMIKSANVLPPSEGSFSKIQKAQSVSVSTSKLF